MVGLVLFVWLGCTADPDNSRANAERREVLSNLAQNVAIGQYEALTLRTGALSEAAMAFCEMPTQAALDEVRLAWWSAREPWKRTELIQFGPTVEYPLRLGPKLDDWPVNVDAIEELIESDKDLSVESFSMMGSATRGFPVLEYLLWGTGEDSLSVLSDGGRRCEAVAGSAGDIAANAVLLLEAWQNDWAAQVSEPWVNTDDDYDNAQDVVDEWVNRMAFTAENIRSLKLGKPVGDDTGGEPQADQLESRYSGRSLSDASDALLGIQAVWDGGFDGQTDKGIRSLVVDETTLIRDLEAWLATSQTRLTEVPEPLEETIVVQPEIVSRAQEALLALQIGLQVDLAQALGVTITFNDNDGD
jgi:predicted lipoprotein